MNVMFWNIRGNESNKEFYTEIRDKHKLDISCIAETWQLEDPGWHSHELHQDATENKATGSGPHGRNSGGV